VAVGSADKSVVLGRVCSSSDESNYLTLGSAPYQRSKQPFHLQVQLYDQLFNRDFVAVQWGGHLCKGFLMRDLGPGGEVRTECWVFVPPSRKSHTHTIIYLPCDVWFQAGLWWVLMPHQPALPMQPGWRSPGLFIPRPPQGPPPAHTHKISVAVRIKVLSCCFVQHCFQTFPYPNRAMNVAMMCRLTNNGNGAE
jgi:hypothetical protein